MGYNEDAENCWTVAETRSGHFKMYICSDIKSGKTDLFSNAHTDKQISQAHCKIDPMPQTIISVKFFIYMYFMYIERDA